MNHQSILAVSLYTTNMLSADARTSCYYTRLCSLLEHICPAMILQQSLKEALEKLLTHWRLARW